MAISSANNEIKKDFNLALTAVAQNRYAFKHIGHDLRKNVQFLVEVIKHNPFILDNIPRDKNTDIAIMKVIQDQPSLLQHFYIEEEYERVLKTKPSLIIESIKKQHTELNILPEKLKHKTLLAIIENQPDMIDNKDINLALLQAFRKAFTKIKKAAPTNNHNHIDSSIKILALVLDQRYRKRKQRDEKTLGDKSTLLINRLSSAQSASKAQEILKEIRDHRIYCQTLKRELQSLKTNEKKQSEELTSNRTSSNLSSFFSNKNNLKKTNAVRQYTQPTSQIAAK